MCGNQSDSVVSESVSEMYPAGYGAMYHIVWAEENKFSPLSSGEATELRKLFAWSLSNGYSLVTTFEMAHSWLTRRREADLILSESAKLKELKRLQSL